MTQQRICRSSKLRRSFLVFLLLFLPPCGPGFSFTVEALYPGEPERILAIYDGGKITLGDLREELTGRRFYEQTPNDASIDWKDFQAQVIREILIRRVLDQEARERGFAKNERYQARLEWDRLKWLTNLAVEQALQLTPPVTQEQMEQYYRDHEDQFTDNTGFTFWHCFIAAPESLESAGRTDAYKRATEILAQLLQGKTWQALHASPVKDASV